MGVEHLALVNQAVRSGAFSAMMAVLVAGLPEPVFDWVIGESAAFLGPAPCPGSSTVEATGAFLDTSDGHGFVDRLQQLVVADFESAFAPALAQALASRIESECGTAVGHADVETDALQAL